MQAEILWEKLRPQIIHEAKKILNFDTSNDLEDYIQEAYPSICEALDKYNKYNSRMKPEVYCLWYVLKRIHNLATKNNHVVYEVYLNGEYKYTLENNEYRRQKKQLKSKGYTIIPKRRIYCESELITEDNKNPIEKKVKKNV